MLSPELKKEVEDFIDFLLEKEKKKEKENIQPKKERQLGLAKGLIEMKPGFDDPLEDFKEYME
jgi:hypothetical protein